MSLVPALLAGLAAAVLLAPRPARARLAAVLPGPAGVRPVRRRGTDTTTAGTGPAGDGPAGPGVLSRPAVRVLASAIGGVGLVLLLGGAAGVAAGLVVAVAGPAVIARLEPPAGQQEREALEADLPLALDLLAACLAGGAPLAVAAQVVGDAVPEPCGRRLRLVAAALHVGSPPSDAWVALAPWTDDGLVGRAVRTLGRAGEGGAPVAGEVARLADEARTAARARGEQAAQRAGVLAAAPLGLCFLPGFVLLAVVPVLVGLLGPMLEAL